MLSSSRKSQQVARDAVCERIFAREVQFYFVFKRWTAKSDISILVTKLNARIAQIKWCKRMSFIRVIVLALAATTLVACERSGDANDVTDGGLDGGFLADGVANVWIDPDGCQHWYIDDGLEGFMTPRLNRDGTPKCQEARGAITLKDGSTMMFEQEPAMADS